MRLWGLMDARELLTVSKPASRSPAPCWQPDRRSNCALYFVRWTEGHPAGHYRVGSAADLTKRPARQPANRMDHGLGVLSDLKQIAIAPTETMVTVKTH